MTELVALLGDPVVVRDDANQGGSTKARLRKDFVYSCAYCDRAETEVYARAFNIEHYHPRAAGGDDSYSNLHWACERCNGLKADRVMRPDPDHRRIARCDHEDPAQHMRLDPETGVELEAVTSVGEFQICLLLLNAKPHRKVRHLRARLYGAREVIRSGLRYLRARRRRPDSLPSRSRREICRLIEDLDREHGSISEALERTLSSAEQDEVPAEIMTRRRAYLHEKQVLLGRDAPRSKGTGNPSARRRKTAKRRR